ELFSSYARTAQPREYPQERLASQRLMMLNIDPPQHTRVRALVNRGFTPRMVNRLTERITASCQEIVDSAVEKGEGDFVTLGAAELRLVVIAELMGVPLEDRHKVFDWSNRMVGADDPYFERAADSTSAATEMITYANELGARKRGCPVDDIVS